MDNDESPEEYKERLDKLFNSWKMVRDKCIEIGLNPNIKFQDVKRDIENGNKVSELYWEFYVHQKWIIDFSIAIDLEHDFMELNPPLPEPSTSVELIEYLNSL